MSAGWVAGSTRARLLAQRRLGPDGARAVAASGSLAGGVAGLSGTRFNHVAGVRGDLEEVQRAVAACVLLELRVLAGWLPVGAGELVRSLAAWFELVNVEDRLAYLLGGDLRTPFAVGALASSWPRASAAETPGELRDAMRASAWGDTGGERAETIHLALRLSWARRVLAAAPEAQPWVAGAVGIVVARELFLGEHPVDASASPVLRELGPSWAGRPGLGEFTAALAPRAAWPLAGLTEPSDLWRAETVWWQRVAHEGESFMRGPREGRAVVVGSVALLAVDAVRVSTALALAAHPGGAGEEVLRALL